MKDIIIQFQNYFKCTKWKGTFPKWGVITKLYSYSSKNGRREDGAGESAKEYHKSKSVQ
jgi:hypothetical protein